jgi:hypothetical protein
MNLNGEEKRIRQLFRELSSHEREQAPDFAAVLASANAPTVRSRNGSRSWRFAMACTVLPAVLSVAMAIILQLSQGNDPSRQASTPDSQAQEAPALGPLQARATPDVPPRKRGPRPRRQRRTSDPMTIAMKTLFAWRSPTASLLKIPEDELLRSLPRLGESFQTIKSYSPDQFN